MIMRVYEQVKKAKSIQEVIVATDDWRIFDHVQAAGGRVVMTADHHRSGTDRIAEVARKLKDIDLVINIQGDEPFIHPASIDRLIAVFAPAAQSQDRDPRQSSGASRRHRQSQYSESRL